MILENIYGYHTLKTTSRLENGKLILGGIITKYDRDGNQVSQKSCDTISMFFEKRLITRWKRFIDLFKRIL